MSQERSPYSVDRMLHPSFKPDPGQKGSYYRRIEDIGRGLKHLGADSLPPAAQFLTYWFGCEKLACGTVGIHTTMPADKAYSHKNKRGMHLKTIQSAAVAMGLSVSSTDLAWLFADASQQNLLDGVTMAWSQSARVLRNSVIHDFGPSNVERLAQYVPFHVPRMRAFLGCAPQVLDYLKRHFGDRIAD